MPKIRKGRIFRPCRKCGSLVNFIPWPEERHRGNIWHWANEDGSHHKCREYVSPEIQHIRDILSEA